MSKIGKLNLEREEAREKIREVLLAEDLSELFNENTTHWEYDEEHDAHTLYNDWEFEEVLDYLSEKYFWTEEECEIALEVAKEINLEEKFEEAFEDYNYLSHEALED